eukprot:SAG31_NODE_287_length_18430_cov_8.127544_11_plen_200_part_00
MSAEKLRLPAMSLARAPRPPGWGPADDDDLEIGVGRTPYVAAATAQQGLPAFLFRNENERRAHADGGSHPFIGDRERLGFVGRRVCGTFLGGLRLPKTDQVGPLLLLQTRSRSFAVPECSALGPHCGTELLRGRLRVCSANCGAASTVWCRNSARQFPGDWLQRFDAASGVRFMRRVGGFADARGRLMGAQISICWSHR